VCMYTSTPDEQFIIDQAPGMDRMLLVSGCSGHGFKFTALLGDIAARLVTGRGYARDLGRFSLSRFS
jgi:glycine/D-amino acid oxidase-like deaminating enzyme